MAECLVELRDLWVRLGGEDVLRGIDLCVPKGSYLVVLGPSGSGKTTLLRTVAGLVTPARGSVMIDGGDVTVLPPWERGVALVQQIPGLLPHLSVLDNIVLAMRARLGLSGDSARREALSLLDKLRIREVAHRKPGELSGGQLQRAAIAIALAIRPKVLLLDEPLSHLDRPLAERLRLELRRIHRELGITVIHVTHDQDEALSLATRLAILWNGEVLEDGEPEEIYQHPRSLVSAEFLGLNIIDARVLGEPGKRAILPPEAVKITTRSSGLRAIVRDIVRERGRVIIYARLAETGDPLRIYLHPRELRLVNSDELFVEIERDSIHFV